MTTQILPKDQTAFLSDRKKILEALSKRFNKPVHELRIFAQEVSETNNSHFLAHCFAKIIDSHPSVLERIIRNAKGV